MKSIVMNHGCERACQIAKKSGMNHRHGAVVLFNGDIISEGYNRECSEFKEQYSVHAEVDALLKIRRLGKHILSRCDLVVVRIGPESLDHAMKFSMPCAKCGAFIERMGIRKVYYSTNEEFDTMIQQNDKYIPMQNSILQMRENYILKSTTKRRFRTDPPLESSVTHSDGDTYGYKSPRHGRARRNVDQSDKYPQCLRQRRPSL
jgi:deoxycytidylate deaminase